MDPFRNPPADSLAAARLHVQALTECGLPREALLRALLENYGPSEGDTAMTMDAGFAQSQSQSQSQRHSQQQQPPPQQPQHLAQMQTNISSSTTSKAAYNARLSVSTTSSRSSGRASVLSTATSLSSVSSQAAPDMAPFPPPPTPAPSVKSNNRGTSKPQGAYWCTFCDVAFQRKFDWKRHEDEFHERYKRYPCPNCNRIFWGANTFNQHHKNAHGCTTCPHADRVVQYTQRKQAWACGFCGGFLASRDRYFDHVARHYEDGCNKSHWNHSLVIYGLLHQPTITHAWKELFPGLYSHLPRDQQPILEWDIKVTGHAQGFLEGESPGKLQDLLEFFNDTRDDPRFLAKLALDSARIRHRHELQASPPTAGAPAAAAATRPASLPPKSAVPKLASSPASSKHMSAPQRGMASSPSPFSTPSQLLRTQQPAQQPQHPSPQNNPFLSSYPQPIMETPEPDHPYFMLNAVATAQANSNGHHMQAAAAAAAAVAAAVATHHPQIPQHHSQISQHHSHISQQQHHQHHQHHHELSVPTISENLFEDWSSMSTTVVDEAAFSMSEGWETGGMDLRSPHLGTDMGG